jgi:hypothetical protein
MNVTPFFSRLWVRVKVPNLLSAAQISKVPRLWSETKPAGAVSGVGTVAVGAVFSSGKVVLEWIGADSSFEILDGLDHVERIHGHGGRTRIAFAIMRSVSRPKVSTRRKV